MLWAQAASKQAGPNMKMGMSQKAGKVTDFDGRQDNWHDWAPRPKCHVDGIHAGAEELAEWAAARNHETHLDDLEHHNNPEAQETSGEIYYPTTWRAYGEALEDAMLMPRNNGAELWRKVSKRHDPRASAKRAALLNTIIQHKALSVEELGHTG